MHDGDYHFLERFLDSTKANLFFAKGVLIVEGDAENLLLPALAEVIGKKLSKHGVSIVNVGSKALLRYAKIFIREKDPTMMLPVAVITDCDLNLFDKTDGSPIFTDFDVYEDEAIKKRELEKVKYSDGNVQGFISPQWTLEFDIACSCLKTELYAAILMATDYEKADKRLQESKNPSSIKEVKEYLEDAETAIAAWSGLHKFNIAKNISEKVVIKSNSKAVAAQCFAKILLSRKFIDEEIEKIKNDACLEYLVDAITYVTRR